MFLALVVVAAGGILNSIICKQHQTEKPICSAPGTCINDYSVTNKPLGKPVNQLSYRSESKSFVKDADGYECTKPIKLVSNSIDTNGQYVDYRPADAGELSASCRMTVTT